MAHSHCVQIVTFYFEYLWKEQLRSSDKIAFVGGALSYLLSQLAGILSEWLSGLYLLRFVKL